MNYGAAGGLLGKATQVVDGMEHAAESVEENIVESAPIDVGNVPIPNVVDKAASIGSKAKAVMEGANAKVAEHVEKAKEAFESSGVGVMLAAIYAKLTSKRFHGFHIFLAIVITIVAEVIYNSVSSSVSRSAPLGDVDDMQIALPSSALLKQPVSVTSFVPSGNGVRTFHA